MIGSILFAASIACEFSQFASARNEVICNELYAIEVNENGLPVLGIAYVDVKNENTKIHYGVNLSTGDPNTDYAHLISRYNVAKNRTDLEILEENNRIRMNKTFNRTGLWHQSEVFEMQKFYDRGKLVTLTGYIPKTDEFYRVLYDPKTESAISFLFPNQAGGDLRDHITSIGCIERKAGRKLLHKTENYKLLRITMSYNLDLWAPAKPTRGC